MVLHPTTYYALINAVISCIFVGSEVLSKYQILEEPFCVDMELMDLSPANHKALCKKNQGTGRNFI